MFLTPIPKSLLVEGIRQPLVDFPQPLRIRRTQCFAGNSSERIVLAGPSPRYDCRAGVLTLLRAPGYDRAAGTANADDTPAGAASQSGMCQHRRTIRSCRPATAYYAPLPEDPPPPPPPLPGSNVSGCIAFGPLRLQAPEVVN